MTAPALPPFPEKPVFDVAALHGAKRAAETRRYYRDLAAAWEARCREAVQELENTGWASSAHWKMSPGEYRDQFEPWAKSRAQYTLSRIGPLPPKED